MLLFRMKIEYYFHKISTSKTFVDHLFNYKRSQVSNEGIRLQTKQNLYYNLSKT